MDILASNSRLKVTVEKLLEQKKVRKSNVEDRHDRTARGAPAEKRGNGETKSGDRERARSQVVADQTKMFQWRLMPLQTRYE